MKLPVVILAVAVLAAASIKAQDKVDPDTREQIEAAKKQADKMGVKTPDIDKLMADEAKEDAAAKTETAKTAPATKGEPLAALPPWIPPVDGFQTTVGAGKHWIDKNGKEQGALKGIVSGDSHAVFKKWEASTKSKFSGPDTVWEPTIGDINGKHYVSLHTFRRDTSGTDFCDVRLEIESTDGGKSNVTITYVQPTAGCGEKK
jgi:hypothetical protein